MPWQEILSLNRPIILFVYGQVFFVLGLAIFLQSRRHSRLKLARDLRWLALFGILHGLHEWGLVFIPIQAEYLGSKAIELLLVFQVLLLAASFLCLLIFGYVLLEMHRPALRWLVIGLIAAWILAVILTRSAAPTMAGRLWLANIWARYLLGLPGSLLAAWGLRVVAREVATIGEPRFARMLNWAAAFLAAYGLFAGLIVSQAPFFPASVLNREAVEAFFGIPVEAFRSLAGLGLTISVIRALEVFRVEVDRLIETMETEAIRAAERDQIGREIHDGAMQGVYAARLILDSLAKFLTDNPPAYQRLEQAREVIDQAIQDLRHYMTSLRVPPPQISLGDGLVALAAEPRFNSLIDVRLEVNDGAPLDAESIGHLLGIAREALSNAVRHAAATSVIIRTGSADGSSVLEIIDNGHGFNPETEPGFGLRAIREHARLANAHVTVRSDIGIGTAVQVIYPGQESGL